MRNLKIAVIDDGVNDGYYKPLNLVCDIEISRELQIKKRKHNNSFINSHATTCAAIICKYAKEAQIVSIKILDIHLKNGRIGQLAKALEYCIENNIKLINISLGSTNFADYKIVCEKISNIIKEGGIIVSAVNNQNIFSIPACIGGVIGVISNEKSCKYAREAVTANGKHILRNYTNEFEITEGSNSFAAAYVTAGFCKRMMSNSRIDFFNLPNESVSRSTGLKWYFKEYFLNIKNIHILSSNKNGDIDKLKKVIFKQKTACSIILATPENSEYIIETLYSIRKFLTSIVLTYKPIYQCDYSKITQSGIFLWDVNQQDIWMKQMMENNIKLIDTQKLDCLIIGIKGNDTNLRELKECFEKSGYNVLSITQSIKGVISGHYFLDFKNQNITRMLKLLFMEFNCDLMLIQAHENSDGIFDMFINLDDYNNISFVYSVILEQFS